MATTGAAQRSRYVSDSVGTASPARLLCMLFDRLVLDVTLGARALEAGDREAAAHRLLHAQDILLHLRSTLDVESWPPGGALASVYVWCWQELVAANTRQDTGKAVGVLALVTALRDSWQQAARLSQRD